MSAEDDAVTVRDQVMSMVGDGSAPEVALAARIVAGFGAKADRLLGELGGAGSGPEIEHAAHAVRGAAALVGYRSMTGLAARVESAAGSGETVVARALLPDLRALLDDWPAVLDRAVQDLGRRGDPGAEQVAEAVRRRGSDD